jgi:N-acetylmuramic acid 6-phosphate etherase
MARTEEQSDQFAELDRWDDLTILTALVDGQAHAVMAVRKALPLIAETAQAIADRLRGGGRLIYAGAGTSIRIAVQDGSELPATFGMPQDKLVYLIAGGREAMFEGAAEAEDDVQAAIRDVEAAGCSNADALIAVAASGTTPYTVAAARRARELGSLVIAVANNSRSELARHADHEIFLDSGPEVIAGSTRMGAGTAQKCALNLLSTLVHVRLGAIYGGMMVNVRADNAKLKKRARAIVARIAKVDDDIAGAALDAAEGEVKPAVLICAGARDLARADQLLGETQGNLRQALEKLRAV